MEILQSETWKILGGITMCILLPSMEVRIILLHISEISTLFLPTVECSEYGKLKFLGDGKCNGNLNHIGCDFDGMDCCSAWIYDMSAQFFMKCVTTGLEHLKWWVVYNGWGIEWAYAAEMGMDLNQGCNGGQSYEPAFQGYHWYRDFAFNRNWSYDWGACWSETTDMDGNW